MDDAHKKIYEGDSYIRDYGGIRTKEYCIDECKSLAKQLNMFNIKE